MVVPHKGLTGLVAEVYRSLLRKQLRKDRLYYDVSFIC